jgi:hypothetical protein
MRLAGTGTGVPIQLIASNQSLLTMAAAIQFCSPYSLIVPVVPGEVCSEFGDGVAPVVPTLAAGVMSRTPKKRLAPSATTITPAIIRRIIRRFLFIVSSRNYSHQVVASDAGDRNPATAYQLRSVTMPDWFALDRSCFSAISRIGQFSLIAISDTAIHHNLRRAFEEAAFHGREPAINFWC